MPARLLPSVSVWRGDPLTITLKFWTDNTQTTPMDLTGVAPSWLSEARGSMTDSDPAATFTVDASNAATGTLVLTLAGTVTAGMGLASYGFDVQGSGGSVSPVTLVQGTLAVDGDWSR